MSSSNRVRLALIKEAVYGETPVAGDFSRLGFTSEGLSGTPQTTESQIIRDDRMGQGQVNVGLESGGEVASELRKDPTFEQLLESAMMNTWAAAVTMDGTFTVNKIAKTIVRAAGSFIDDEIKVGDLLRFGADFVANKGTVKVTSVTALTLEVVGKIEDEVDLEGDLIRPQYLDIGAEKHSFSVEKAFLDLTNKAIIYPGVLVNTLSLNSTYKQIATYSLGMVSNGYKPVDAALDFITNGRTILPATTKDSMNSSVDLSLLLIDGEVAPFILRSVVTNLNNNMSPKEGIGKLAPYSFTEGEATVTAELEAYLEDGNWDLLQKKIEQTPLSLDHVIENDGEGYAVSIPALQVSFPDPSSGGKNQDMLMSMSGTAKIGANGESVLRIYKF